MASDIKDLLNSIISDTDHSYPTDTESVGKETNPNVPHFDRGAFREKLSLNVLHDIIGAMMHDETKDLDGMIDMSIMRHINDNYNGSCYGYLKSSCEKLKSPILGNIIQEIEEKCDCVAQEVCTTKDPGVTERSIDTKELLKDVEHYDELRERIKDEVTKKVIDDVTKAIVDQDAAPKFDKLDEKLEKTNKKDSDDTNETLSDDVATESFIVRMCGPIVTECARNGEPISTEEGLQRAIVEYCIVQMDSLFKQYNTINGFDKYLK
jgi:hypothetical protein